MQVTKESRIVVKLWDGDIYILTGFKTAREADAAMEAAGKIEMPNGDMVKYAAIEKVQSFDSYTFQTDQKVRHKRGQYIEGNEWRDIGGYVTEAKLESITGGLALPTAPAQKRLTEGRGSK